MKEAYQTTIASLEALGAKADSEFAFAFVLSTQPNVAVMILHEDRSAIEISVGYGIAKVSTKHLSRINELNLYAERGQHIFLEQTYLFRDSFDLPETGLSEADLSRIVTQCEENAKEGYRKIMSAADPAVAARRSTRKNVSQH